MAVYAMALAASLFAAYKYRHRAIAPWNEAVTMTTPKSGSTEDWTHLGKLDTSRVLVRAEGAIWKGLAAVGVPAGVSKVLKWSVRGAVLAAAAVYSLYLFVPLILGCLALWMVAQSSELQSESRENASSGYRDGISGYGFYDAAGIKHDD